MRARRLASMVVLATAGVASASLDLVVTTPAGAAGFAPVLDGGLGAEAGSDALLDGGVGMDTFIGSDASIPDASLPDAGTGSDAGIPDASLPDAGTGSDAGIPDASLPDAGTGSDAGLPDASLPDAGSGSDAGLPDGGVPDAGSGSDGGGGSASVQVTPAAIDFGEVRVGTPQPSFEITVTNAPSATAAAQVTAFDLREHRPGLVLDAPGVPFAIAPGTSQTATLSLETTADSVLDGEYIDIVIDGATVEVPVAGKVVTPSSRVAPTELDLGTACVGTQVSGNVLLINDGTATLAVDPPQMDQSFVASSPGTPRTLAPMMSLTATVSPAMNAAGALAGTMTWHDDVPSDYAIPVTLEYVTSGTALSPRGLDFGTVEVDIPVAPQALRLQNCDPEPSSIEIESLKTKQGTLGAWLIEPRVGYTKQLASHEEQAVSVTFQPPARGRYEAELTVRTIDGRKIVHLVGDATGRDFERTSFYACACNGPGAPARGWPILAAIAIVISRRRRVSSSAR